MINERDVETIIRTAAARLDKAAYNVYIQGNEIRYTMDNCERVIQFDSSDDFSRLDELEQELNIAVQFAVEN